MSGYALLARAWGAEVAGWDRVETPYLRHLEGIAVEISPEPPPPPPGWEVFVSTAFAGRVEGRPRADLLAELVAAAARDRRRRRAREDDDERDDRLLPRPARPRPGLPHRRRRAAARRQRARRRRLARRRGGRVGSLRRRAAAGDRRAAQRRPRPPHDVRLAGRGRVVLRGLAARRAAASCGRRSSSPSSSSFAVPGEHNRRNAAAALAALELAGVPRADAEAAIVEFRGAGRRLEPKGEAGGVTVLDSYAHHPAELAADLAAVRRRRAAAGALPAAPLLADAPPRARLRRGARRRGCGVRDRDLPGSRGARARRDADG